MVDTFFTINLFRVDRETIREKSQQNCIFFIIEQTLYFVR